MNDSLHRVPILQEPDIPCPIEGLTPRFNGFRTLGEVLEVVAPQSRGAAIEFTRTALAAGKIVWRDEWSPLRWCDACDVPLLQDTCGLCGAAAGPCIELRFPCNPRPLIPHDEFIFRAAGLPWPAGRAVVVNAWSHAGRTGWELVCAGTVVGDIIHQAREDAYVFQPTNSAVASLIAGSSGPAPTLATLLRANQAHLDALEQEAVRFIRAWCRKGPLQFPVTTFSGGKDSVVLAHLCHQSGVKMRLVQVDTGIDPAGNHEFSDRLLAKYPNLKPTRLESGDLFWRALEKLGPPAQDFQWCRMVLKNSAPHRSKSFRWLRLLRRVKGWLPVQAIIVDGPRKREEPWRIALKRTIRIPEAPVETITIRPILDFTDLDIWMFLERHGLEINPTYHRDRHQRLVCLFCPEKDRHELRTIQEREPAAWRRFETELERWRALLGFPREWTCQHLWRFDKPVSAEMRQLGITSRLELVSRELTRVFPLASPRRESGATQVSGKITVPFDMAALARWLHALGKVRLTADAVEVTTAMARARFNTAGVVEVMGDEEMAVTEFARLLQDWVVSWLNCIGCGLCRASIGQVRIRAGRACLGRFCRASAKRVQAAVAGCPMNPRGLLNCLTPRQDA